MNYCIKRDNKENNKAKIPRPPNAFMLYANENRKRMSQMYPTESNKDISKRLGNGWKCLDDDERKKFFDRAKAIGIQHKKEHPDYVYNPKEARIRKAMRDATRERSIGASPMLSRPSARRATHNWVSPHEELMMSPLANMRASMEPQVCGGFPMASGGNQFMSAMNGYNKLEASMPSASSVHNAYMQTNPLAQLQQHTEMWTDYHQPIRPRSSGNPFMMSDVSSYQPTSPVEMSRNLLIEKSPQIRPVAAMSGVISPTNNENIPPDGGVEKSHADVGNFENAMVGAHNPGIESDQDHFMPIFEQRDVDRRAFEQMDDAKIKKPAVPQICTNNNNNMIINKKPTSKPLPDFNEAFGSTERGRFQSPPDPRLAPSKGYLDYFYDNSNPIKFDDYQN